MWIRNICANGGREMISSEKVSLIFKDCLYKKEEIVDGEAYNEPIIVESISFTIYINPEKVEKHRKEISLMLGELDDRFDKGWSFLGLHSTKDGECWAGEHKIMEELMILGIATGLFEYCLPKSQWFVLPSQLPYIKRVSGQVTYDTGQAMEMLLNSKKRLVFLLESNPNIHIFKIRQGIVYKGEHGDGEIVEFDYWNYNLERWIKEN